MMMDQSETMIQGDQSGVKKIIRLKRRNSGENKSMNKSQNETVRSNKKGVASKEPPRTDEQTQKLKAEYEALLDLDIDEIDKRLEKVERDIKNIETQKVQVMRNKAASKRMQILQLRDLDEAMHFQHMRREQLAKAKDFKIPFYQKLPKDSQFYLHYMNAMWMKRVLEAGSESAQHDLQMMQGIGLKLH